MLFQQYDKEAPLSSMTSTGPHHHIPVLLQITFELSSKYSTDIAFSLVGAQQGFGTLSGNIRWTCDWEEKERTMHEMWDWILNGDNIVTKMVYH